MTTCAVHSLDRLASADAPPRSHARVGWWLLAGFCAAAALVGRLSYLARVFDADGAMFIYMGKLTSEGGRLGHDLIDNKFPTVGLMTSVPWRLFEANWNAYVLLGVVLALASAMCLARIARRHIGAHAVLPTVLFALVYLNFNTAVFGGFQLETSQIFFTILAASAALGAISLGDARDAFVVGLAAGCAAMLKPTGLAIVGAFGLMVLLMHARDPRRLFAHGGAVLLGLAIPAAAVLAYLVAADTLRDMPQLARQISTYAKQTAWNRFDLFKIPTLLVIAGFPFLVRGWVFRRPPYRIAGRVDPRVVGFVALWLMFEVAGVVMQRRMYAYHFLVLAPPLALLFGMLPRRDALRPLAAGLVPVALLSAYGAATVIYYEYREEELLPASSYLLAHTEPDDAVWQDEMMRLLIETNLRPGSRVPMGFLFANHDEAPVEFSSIILEDFERVRPKYVLLRTDFDATIEHYTRHIAELDRVPRRRDNFVLAWRRIRAYVERHYHVEAQIGRETVYRRSDGEVSAR